MRSFGIQLETVVAFVRKQYFSSKLQNYQKIYPLQVVDYLEKKKLFAIYLKRYTYICVYVYACMCMCVYIYNI